MITTNETYPWSFVTRILRNGLPSHGGDRQTFEVMTSISPLGSFGSITSLVAAALYTGNHARNQLSGISDQLREIYSIYIKIIDVFYLP